MTTEEIMSTTFETTDPQSEINRLQEALGVLVEKIIGLAKEHERLKHDLAVARAVIVSDCETEEIVKNLARPYLPDYVDVKDSIPTSADIVKELIKLIPPKEKRATFDGVLKSLQ